MHQISGALPDHPLAILIFVGFAIILITVLRNGGGGISVPPPVAKPFLTDRELAMLEVLPMYRVHAQVTMGALYTDFRRPRGPLLRTATISRSEALRQADEESLTDQIVHPFAGRTIGRLGVEYIIDAEL